MKTYSTILNRVALTLIASFMLCSMDASASALTNGLEIPTSEEAIKPTNEMQSQLSTLQIVSFAPFLYNGNVHIRCHGTNTGRATVEATGGVPPYSYSWSSGFPMMGGQMAVALFAGSVTVTVTDAVGTSVSQSVTLTENPPLQAIATVDPILCHGGVATVNLSGAGGTMPYNGTNTSYQFAAGQYDFTIADANGCRNSVIVDLIEPPVLQATSIAAGPILCNGDVTQVNVEAVGGVSPYNNTGVYNEGAGNSSYIITDANGCYAYTSLFINQPPPLAAIVNASEVACRGDVADITVDAIGGIGPYMGTGNFTAIEGNLSYTVTDANGCQASSWVQVTQPPALVATISNSAIPCNGDLSVVQVAASGGMAPYVGIGSYFEAAGTHTFTVEDANGCWVDISTYIIEPKEIEVALSWTPIMNNPTTDVLVIADGGTPAYVGTGLYPTAPGTHTFTVYDANGCTGSEVITISNPISTPQNSDVVISEHNNGWKSVNHESSEVNGSFNPSNDQIEINYELSYDSKVSVEIYDMSGALVESIEEENIALKDQSDVLAIDSGKFRSGIYVYHFVTNTERHVGKLQIIQ
ncbi:MAG: T9SS type A sorting domain-containing protein [Crocinitomicaceae bacterium]